jgi:indole-3-glycerol phosphate synthase
MRFLKQLGVHAALIGEGLVNAPDIAVQIKRLLGRRV